MLRLRRLPIALLFAAIPLVAAEVVPKTQPVFPLGNHSSWQYTGTIQTRENPVAQPIETRMDVIESFKRGDIRAAWVRGIPLGLTEKNTGDYVIAQTGNRLYIVASDRSGEVLRRLHAPSDNLEGLLAGAAIVLDFPLTVGAKTCSESGVCWTIESEKSPEEHKYPSKECEYEITAKDADGSRTISLVPDIGITGFSFERNGGRDWAKLRLGDYSVRAD
jgi:hypothetical protein